MAPVRDGEQTLSHTSSERAKHASPTPVTSTTAHQKRRYLPTRLPPRWFVAAVTAIGGMQLLSMMDGTMVVVALPSIQNDLSLTDAGRNWVITAYVLTFGGLMLLGGRLGDTIGRKRSFVCGALLFTIASAVCGTAWDGVVLVLARLLQGAAAAIIAPTSMALVATTFPKGRLRNAAMAVLGALTGIGSVGGLVLGGALTELSWRYAFLVNLPLGLLVLYLAHTALRETQKERVKLDVSGGLLATLICTAVVFGFSMGPERGWLSAVPVGSAAVALGAAVAFVLVERRAENPIVPFNLFCDRNRLAIFAAVFLAGGVLFSLIVLVALYVQYIMGYSPLQAGVGYLPFAIAVALGTVASSQLVRWFSPRVVMTTGGALLVGALVYGSTLTPSVPYFPNLVLALVVAAIGIGIANVPLALSLIASVDVDRIGAASAIALMLQNLGGPLVLAVIQVAVTSRTLSLGGTQGPVKYMNAAQMNALDHGITYGLLWLAGVVVVTGVPVLSISYSAQQVAHAQQVKDAMDNRDL